jgi:hypothetical protein
MPEGTMSGLELYRRGDPDHQETLRDDALIGELQPDDLFEYVQIYRDKDGTERTTWVAGDAAVWDLGPAEGRWDGPIQTTIEMEWREPGE